MFPEARPWALRLGCYTRGESREVCGEERASGFVSVQEGRKQCSIQMGPRGPRLGVPYPFCFWFMGGFNQCLPLGWDQHCIFNGQHCFEMNKVSHLAAGCSLSPWKGQSVSGPQAARCQSIIKYKKCTVNNTMTPDSQS